MAQRGKTGIWIGVACGCMLFLCAMGGSVAGVVYYLEQTRHTPPPPDPQAAPSPELEPVATEATELPDIPTPDASQGEVPGAAGALTVSPIRFTDEAGEVDRNGKYRAGEKIHYKFDITGISRDATGSWDVSMHLKVTSPAGDVVLDQMMVEQQGQLPEPLPLSGYVELQEGSPAGEYQVLAVIRDKLAAADVEQPSTFNVE